MRNTVKKAAKFSATGMMLTAVVMLSGCSLYSSLFAGKKESNPPTPLTDFKSTETLKTVWSRSVGKSDSFVFSPAFAAGSIYAAAANGNVVRLDVATGAEVWRINAGMSLTAGVGSDGNTTVVVGEKGVVLAFDSNGKERWRAQGPSVVLSAPAVGQELVVVRSMDNHITAYDASTGERRWSAVRAAPALTLRTAPGIAMAAQTAFVALPGGKLSALALNNGGARWEIPVGDPRGTTELERISDVSGMPALIGRDICAVAYQGRIGCFDVANGALRWIKDFSSDVGLGIDERFVFAADEKGAVVEFARDTGAALWRNNKLAYRQLSAPVSFRNTVAVGDYQGYVHFLSREDGAFAARTATDGSAIVANPVAADNIVVFQTQAGTVVALAVQ
ncbi:outer membrane protein assembly factor BamB [Herbaspirillum sp. RTI4]|uniref:outer membrane protein assembly factor BamB n=1 Tax=Herbaspirillum sp. RTI4 TaxID=3048640 RepID=UPI002AB32EDF|nr:outer membrane protein assembly factor BamB [Herbaspirillum sp. RTI4]MDY7578612.1 outer membrane protein assembly factor BamB [Herbaspirillum sp. RTI4]MEA9981082.1 outer membrane protein assembly factor BamB [Herbaspirillum sp. RTI4]